MITLVSKVLSIRIIFPVFENLRIDLLDQILHFF